MVVMARKKENMFEEYINLSIHDMQYSNSGTLDELDHCITLSLSPTLTHTTTYARTSSKNCLITHTPHTHTHSQLYVVLS